MSDSKGSNWLNPQSFSLPSMLFSTALYFKLKFEVVAQKSEAYIRKRSIVTEYMISETKRNNRKIRKVKTVIISQIDRHIAVAPK
jgi:hypothetical protein